MDKKRRSDEDALMELADAMSDAGSEEEEEEENLLDQLADEVSKEAEEEEEMKKNVQIPKNNKKKKPSMPPKKPREPAPEFPPVEHHRPRVFSLRELPAMNDFLSENGYAVVKIYDPSAPLAKELVGDLWDSIREMNPSIDPANISGTCGNDQWPGTFKDGVFSDHHAGHSKVCWKVRGITEIRDVFASIWKRNMPEFAAQCLGKESGMVSDADAGMFVSFDGFNAMRPTDSGKNWRWATKGGWYHVDQVGKGFQCVQGLLNLVPCLKGYSPGFTCIPKSHKDDVFEQIFARDGSLKRTGKDWVMLKAKHVADAKNLRPIVVQLDAGELVLWDSRTIHANDPGNHKLDPARERLRRAAVYVCMTPAMLVRKGAVRAAFVAKRLQAVRDGRTTTHWPHKLQFHTPGFWKQLSEQRRAPKRPKPAAYSAPELSEYQEKLVRGEC